MVNLEKFLPVWGQQFTLYSYHWCRCQYSSFQVSVENRKQSDPNDQSKQRLTSSLANEMPQLLEARENASDQSAVGICFASDWLKGWSGFFRRITRCSRTKEPKQTQIALCTSIEISLFKQLFHKPFRDSPRPMREENHWFLRMTSRFQRLHLCQNIWNNHTTKSQEKFHRTYTVIQTDTTIPKLLFHLKKKKIWAAKNIFVAN